MRATPHAAYKRIFYGNRGDARVNAISTFAVSVSEVKRGMSWVRLNSPHFHGFLVRFGILLSKG